MRTAYTVVSSLAYTDDPEAWNWNIVITSTNYQMDGTNAVSNPNLIGLLFLLVLQASLKPEQRSLSSSTMALTIRGLIWVWLCPVVVIVTWADSYVDEKVRIWPMPAHVQYGNDSVYVSKHFALSIVGNYPDSDSQSSAILNKGFSRLLHNMNLVGIEEENANADHLLLGLRVSLDSWDDQLLLGTDETYELNVPDPEHPNYAYLKGKTVYGALHGLETLSQLCLFNSKTRNVVVWMAPWIVIDQPRFSYRGLLI
ncbi:hypothetical protein KI387_013132, partial [Taxus chinensis]